MYLHATDKVMKDDNLLALFDIPKILWPRLRLSWQRRRHHMITGRMDFCMDERGLKVYEYNADSASCHTEGGLILEQWLLKQGYYGTGHNPAEGLLDELAGRGNTAGRGPSSTSCRTRIWKRTTTRSLFSVR